MTTLRNDHPALRGKGRTIFLKSVKPVKQLSKLIKSGSNNTKLTKGDKLVTKGAWKGMPMYQLILEERKTCPRSCQQWTNCYGNNVFLAHRVDHTDPKFYDALTSELEDLQAKHTKGFVLRLHVLGDFFNKTYVRFWTKALSTYPSLRIFGYTHRWPEHKDGIGREIEKLNAAGAWIRWSDRGGPMSANVGGLASAEAIQCPEETGKTKSCLTCALCWSTTKEIKFLPH